MVEKKVLFTNEVKMQKLKNTATINIGKNIKEIRLSQNIGQTQLVQLLQLQGISITREALVKIERGTQHIYTTELKAIRDTLNTTYDNLLK